MNGLLKVGTLFSGIGSPEFALQKLNVNFESNFACEIDDYARLSFLANHKIDKNNFHKDIYSINPNDLPKNTELLVAGFPCFTAGHKIMTLNGYKNIEDIDIEDYVLTHKNRYRKVNYLMTKEINDIYHLKIYGSVLHKVTSEHPYYVVEKYKIWNKITRKYEVSYSKPKWVETKNLIPGKHYVLLNINNQSNLNLDLNIQIEKKYKNKYIPFDIDEFYWFIGRFLADGWYEDGIRKGRNNSLVNKVFLCSSHKEKEFIVNKLDKLNLHYVISKEKNTYKYIFSNKLLVEFFKKFGRYAGGKKIPKEIFDLEESKLKFLLEGYETGDGYYNKKTNYIHITTINENLALGIQNIIHKVYKRPALIRFCKTKDKTIIENRIVNQKDFFIISYKKIDYEKGRKQTDIIYDYMCFPIKKNIKQTFENKIKVYNLEVEEDNSYTINNIIVHNCQSFSSAGRGEGINDSKGRGILYLEMMRIVENILPNVVLFENVRGITFSKHDELRKDLYRRLEELGYYFDYKILNTSKVTGIPQSRNRWFLVGFRDKEQFDKFQFPKEDKELLDIRNFIDVENKIDDSFYDTEYRFLKNFYINLKDGTDGYISSFTASREYSGFKEYSPTLLAQEYKCPKCIKTKPLAYIKTNFITNGFNYLGYKKYIEENLNIKIEEIKLENFDLEIAKNFGFDYEKFKTFYRKITPRECLNLQGFPEDFKRVVSGLQITKQAGNSMTVDIMAKLIEEILKVYKY